MIRPAGLIQGHYECRSLKETIPIFTDLLAFQLVEVAAGQAIVRHPNTDWLLVAHEGGPAAIDKPLMNHYGVRVASHQEVDAAWEYLTKHGGEYGIERITKPQEFHFALHQTPFHPLVYRRHPRQETPLPLSGQPVHPQGGHGRGRPRRASRVYRFRHHPRDHGARRPAATRPNPVFRLQRPGPELVGDHRDLRPVIRHAVRP